MHPGKITSERMVGCLPPDRRACWVCRPERLQIGRRADLTIFDTERRWTYDVNRSLSKSRNSPLHGHEFQGGPVATHGEGQVRVEVGVGC